MRRPCSPKLCRHCRPGAPCVSMRAWLADEAHEMATAEAMDNLHPTVRRVHPSGESWFDRTDPYPVRGGYLIDDPIHDGRF